MSQTLTVQVPDEVYRALNENAQRTGRSMEDLVNAWLKSAAQVLNDDPLLRWTGAFTGGDSSVAERHDHHLGQALFKEMRGNGDG